MGLLLRKGGSFFYFWIIWCLLNYLVGGFLFYWLNAYWLINGTIKLHVKLCNSIGIVSFFGVTSPLIGKSLISLNPQSEMAWIEIFSFLLTGLGTQQEESKQLPFHIQGKSVGSGDTRFFVFFLKFKTTEGISGMKERNNMN